MQIKEFLLHPFSVKFTPTNGKKQRISIPKEDKKQIAIRTLFISLLTLGFGCPLALYFYSHRARRNYKQILQRNDAACTKDTDHKTANMGKNILPANSAVLHASNRPNSSPVMHDLMTINTAASKRSLCDRQDGMTCFLNTALQTIAHIPTFRRLFDPSHKLIKSPEESEEHFTERKQIQILTNQILHTILSGQKKAHGLGDLARFAHAHHYKNLPEESRDRIDIEERLRSAGGEPYKWINMLISSMDKDIKVSPVPLRTLEKIYKEKFPKTISCLFGDSKQKLHSTGKDSLPFELEINGQHYELEAIMASFQGHVVPFSKEEGHKFVELNDINRGPTVLSENELWMRINETVRSIGIYSHVVGF